MPRVIDPTDGIIVTANNRVVADDYPDYLCTDCHPPYRASRILARLRELLPFRVEDAATLHADTLSANAALFQARLAAMPTPADPDQAALRTLLLDWHGRMDAGSMAAAGYVALRRALTALLARRSGLEGATAHSWAAVPPGLSPQGQLWWALPTLLRTDDATLLDGWSWDQAMVAALAEAVAKPIRGPWGEAHRPQFVHPLSASFPQAAALLDPPFLPVSGDSDTVLATGLIPAAGPAATYGALSRYVFDVGDWESCRWVVFHGASGHPGSAHYADQNPPWSACRMVPMRYGWPGIAAAAESTQQLLPPKALSLRERVG